MSPPALSAICIRALSLQVLFSAEQRYFRCGTMLLACKARNCKSSQSAFISLATPYLSFAIRIIGCCDDFMTPIIARAPPISAVP